MELTAGAIEKIKCGDIANDAVKVQISGLRQMAGRNRHECTLTDGRSIVGGVTGQDITAKIMAGEIKDGSIIEMTDYACNFINQEHKIVLTGCTPLAEAHAPVKQESGGPSGEPTIGTPGAGKPRPADEPAAPAERRDLLPKTPVSQIRGAFKQEQMTPGPTPSPFTIRALRGAGSRVVCQPIHALNPYSNDWTIRAKLVSKAPLRHFEKGGQQQAVFGIEVVDDRGTTIEITLWRGLAEKFYDHLEEGRVYIFRRGSVKLANKNYKTVRNDYTIHMDSGSEIEQCEDSDVSKMTAKLKFVDFERLPMYAGKKTLVDVLGIVTAVGALGSVKRTRDGTELSRRDVTLVDQGAKTVVVTLWGATAEEVGVQLEQQPEALISISTCRVTDYNGVSLSTVTRSVVTVEPDGDRAASLRQWWESNGRTAPTQHLGEGLASAKRALGGPPERQTFGDLHVPKEELPPADAKPQYHTIIATVAHIDAQQALYYEACPDNNRKVVKQGKGWFCEYDQQIYMSMVRRYVMLAKCVDASGDCLLSVFNEQAEAMLGMSADEISVLKEDEANPAKLEAVLKSAQWSEWVLRVQSRTQEYNGEVRQRLSVASLKPVSFVEESRRMVQELERMTVP
ncbi:hypothetical protein WJX75_006399 [Coccomyxa subellipsoidea]|uniref:Replication protein A subunit n=1 Tax=Coccomyxa subellipsoidea TaxID=248742 RepID=A0ABR2YD89_9CHLO